MSDSDGEYDSEEERLKERLQSIQRQRHVQREAAAQMEALRRHRATQEAVRRATAAAAGSFPQPGSPASDYYHNNDPLHSNRDADILAAHEQRWTEVEHAAAPLSYSDVPWPPFEGEMRRYLLGMAALNGGDLRRAYTRACLRWHPDKFQSKVLGGMAEEEAARAMERVHIIIMALNSAWEEYR